MQRRWQRGQGTRGTNPESAEARWLGAALEEARRAAQERPLAIQVEEGVGCPQTNKASRCRALHWGTTILWPVTSKKSRETRVSEKDPIGERSAVRMVVVVALRGSKSQLPAQIRERIHDEGVWQCLATILGTDLGQCTEAVRELATLPLRSGVMGLTSATRIRIGALGQLGRLFADSRAASRSGSGSSPTVERAAIHTLKRPTVFHAPQDGSHRHGTSSQRAHTPRSSQR